MATRTQKTERGRELDNIKKDLDSLKSNVVALSRQLGDDVRDEAVHSIDVLKQKSNTTFERVEENVRERPGRSMMLAFLGGLAASALLKQRY